jgi:DNA-binding CsgD family transcriptional regulator
MALQPETTSDRLLERDAELAVIEHALAGAAQGAGELIVVDGPAGVGKTSLLAATRTAAAAAGLLTLRARGAELERAFAFGIVRQLFDEVLRDEPADLFTGAARFAAPVLGLELPGGGPVASDDPYAARHALYWLTANLSADRPLALLVDDGHWADSASLDVLVHVAHRLEGIPVALVVASRTEETHETLEALRRHAAAHGTLLNLQPLSEDGAATVIRRFAPGADDSQCRACHAATGGNPFLLRELALAAAGGEGSLDSSRISEQSPERVTQEIAARLARLPEAAVRLARAVAVLGGGVPLRPAAGLAEVDQDAAAEAVDVLVAAGILRPPQPHELLHQLEFVHPLVRAAVYAGLGPAGRSRDHARAARLLDLEAGSPELVAAQLLRCQPAGDPWAYERLVAAARLASARGAADAATLYLRRAVDEPPPPRSRPGVLLDLAAAEFRNSEPGVAIDHLREAMAGELVSDQRFRATMLLSGLLGQTGQVADAVELLEAHVDALADRPDLRATAEAALVNVTRIDPQARPRATRIIERLRHRVEAGQERDQAVLGTISAEMGMAGEPAGPMAELAERALDGFDLTIGSAAGWSGYNAARSLIVAERYDKALQVLDRALEVARQRGAVLDVGSALVFRAELYLQTGDITAAEVDARSLGEIAAVCRWPMGEGFAVAWLGEVLIERGELDEAEAVLPRAAVGALPPYYPLIWGLLARGRLRLLQGRFEEAAMDLRESARRTLGIGHRSPALTPWRSLLAQALLGLGEREEARRLVAEELELAHPIGAARPIGIALRAMARVEGDDVRLLREAAAALDTSQAQLERARAHADLGVALRRAGDADEAREELRLAVDVAHRCGADALEDLALGELRAAGARPRRKATTGADALTPSERRIAQLAASGAQNREIAQALFVTTATVEFHLRNAYRKLGISGRPGLAGALS